MLLLLIHVVRAPCTPRSGPLSTKSAGTIRGA
uniref:Uncharacterized protein n=1 Tax=Magnetospirillum gryphiswaldense TaxID=55518 RepID=A4TYC0_9PROT|nr:hypothetical protein MGR_1552 [Magnetospirillum gryphiswaldense MSR-1]